MKTRLFKIILALTLALIALPMMGQDFMNVYFKNGTFRIFHFNTIVDFCVSRIDASGEMHDDYQFQHIVTNNEEFVYNVADIDSISFTKYQEHIVKANTKEALTSVFPLLSGCQFASDAESKLETIKKSEGVETAWIEGDFVFIKIRGGETISFHFAPDDVGLDDNYDFEQTSRILQAIPARLNKIKDEYGRDLKAVVANQQHFVDTEWRMKQRTDFMYPLRDKLEEAGFQATQNGNIYIEKPDLDFFYNTIYDNDVVFLSTHGGCWEDGGHVLLTGETFGMVEVGEDNDNWPTEAERGVFTTEYNKLFEDPRFQGAQDMMSLTYEKEWRKNGKVGKNYWVSYVILKEAFFRDIVKKRFLNPNSFFFNAACKSLMGGDELGNIMREDRGLGTYVGYTQSNYYGQEAGCTMLTEMLNGVSAQKAFNDLESYEFGELKKELHENTYDVTGTYKDESIIKYKYDEDKKRYVETERYTASVNLIPRDANSYITPVFTKSTDHETATSSFETSRTIEVTGYTTTLSPTNFSGGFEYDTDGLFTSPKRATGVTHKTLNPATEKGNVQFQGNLTELKWGQTYYYRAYTYDGVNYNYGTPRSFTIGEVLNLTLSTDAVELSSGDQVVIEITSGNGDYDIDNSKETVASVKLEGNKIVIDALSSGKTFITITDTKSTQSTAITVTVWAKLSIAIIGNIDLEVGDKTNVRIISGNNDYTLYSDYPNIATPTLIGEFVSVEALSAGKATITVTDNKTGQTASFTVTVKGTEPSPMACPDENHPHIIDLGLPSGTKWACCNIGAEKPDAYGEYFAWGETEKKDKYDWSTYNYCDGTENCTDIGMDIAGSQYDVARAKWGISWSMPNSNQMMELIYCTTHEWTTFNGVNGYQFTGSNGNSIFMPATGSMYSNWQNYDVEKEGNYWSSSRSSNHDYLACYFQFSSKGVNWSNYRGRFYGFSVRPISSGELQGPDLALSTYNPITMNVNAGATFMILSGSGSYNVESSNETVATVTLRDNYVDVLGEAAGTATITVSDTKSGQKKTIEVTVIDNTPLPGTPAEAVDLGLPSGTLWASYNLGATRPEDFGGYYAWGELGARSSFEWEAYQYYNSKDGWLHIGEDIGGTNYDAARRLWGDEWRMPSATQFRELKDNCTIEETKINGVYGRKFTGKNGNSIFLPAGGSIVDNSNNYKGYYGYYLSSNLSSSYNGSAQILFFRQRGELVIVDNGRSNGVCVRPVTTVGTAVPNLVLESTAPLSLKTHQKTSINIISGSGNYTAKSDDESVAIAEISGWVSLETGEKGKCVNVNAVGAGTCNVTVNDSETGETATVSVTVFKDDVAALAIDLGLPSGTKWADRNVGASSSEDFGGLYTWGETEEVKAYATYKWGYGEYGELTKYCTDKKYGTVDNKTVLDPEDDVAYVTWGDLWRMPTLEQAKELVANCNSEWTTLNGVTGRKYTSKINGNSIFIPAVGYFAYETYYSKGSNGFYWLSTLNVKDPTRAYDLYLASGSTGTSANSRHYGSSVRPVTK